MLRRGSARSHKQDMVWETLLYRRGCRNWSSIACRMGLIGDHGFPTRPTKIDSNKDVPMGSISVPCYKPKPGCESALLELVRGHLTPLRAEGLVTDRASIVMRAADGTIIEIFEWVSQEAIAGAHSNPAVLNLWKRFEAVCTYETPA